MEEISTLHNKIKEAKTQFAEINDAYSICVGSFLDMQESQVDLIEDLQQELEAAQMKLTEMQRNASVYTNLQDSGMSCNEKILVLCEQMCAVCDPSESDNLSCFADSARSFFESVTNNERNCKNETKQLQMDLAAAKDQLMRYKNLNQKISSNPEELKKFIESKRKQLLSSTDSAKAHGDAPFDLIGKTFGNTHYALLDICRKRLERYDVVIHDFSTSWESGLAFLGLMHSYRPHLFDFNSVKSKTISGNLIYARELALQLGMPAEDFDYNSLISYDTFDFVKVVELVEKLIKMMKD